jgi:hypothetical protein
VSLSLDYNIKIPEKASLGIFNKLGAIIISGVAGPMDLDLEAGEINVFHPAYPASTDTIDLRTIAGAIILTWPTQSALDIDASVSVGPIFVENFPVTVNSSLIGANIYESVNGGGTDVIIRVEGAGVIKLIALPS